MNKKSFKPRIRACRMLLPIVVFTSISLRGLAQVTLHVERSPARNVLSLIEKQSGYHFVYFENGLQLPLISASVDNVSIDRALAACFENTDISYKIVKKNILLKNRNTPSAENSMSVSRQNYLFKGRVIGEDGEPLPGATIRIKDSNVSSSADKDGYFTISSPGEHVSLVFSFIGYTAIERDSRADLGEVILRNQVSSLQEIEVKVNTGYQTIAKERATGAFASLPKNSLKQQRLNSLSSLLEGRIAGYNNGLLRGTTSMNGVTAPLYVIDGFPVDNTRISANGSIVENLPNLNLEDIESITVLRDAAAASIYGARAANGVVVIVTRQGKAGKTEINASATLTHTPYYFNTDRITSAGDIISLEREWAARNPNLATITPESAQSMLDDMLYSTRGIQTILRHYAGQIAESEMNGMLDEMASSGYRYYDDVAQYGKRDPFSQQYNISLASGSKKNSFYASATYKKDLAEDLYDKSENLGVNLRNLSRINDWLSIEINSFLNYQVTKDQTFNLLSPGFTYMPYDGLINADGSNFVSTAESRLSRSTLDIIRENGLYNMDISPLDELDNNLRNTNRFSNRSFLKLNVKLTDWLNYSGSFQYEYGHDKSDILYDKETYYVRNRVNSFVRLVDGTPTFMMPFGDIYNYTDQTVNTYNFRQQFNIDKTFGNRHVLNAIVGTEIRHNKMHLSDRTLYNYDPMVLSYEMIDPEILSGGYLLGGRFTQGADDGGIYENVNRFVSVYGNAGYTYDNRYLLSGSLRWDRSNLWGTNSKYQNKPLWSLGAGWNIHQEKFYHSAWLNQLKLRTSYGIAGNISHDAGPFMTAYYSNNPNVGGLQGSISNRPNPLLSWEKTTTLNLGLDFGVADSRISGSMDYYRKSGQDLLANTMGVPTEGFGYSTYAINNGKMTNHGFETTLSADVLRIADFTWNTNVLYAFNKNKVTYVNVEAPVYFLQLDYPQAYPRIGNPYQAIYAYAWAGLNEEGMPQAFNEVGDKTTITPTTLNSIVYAGSAVPVHTASWTNSLSYRNFDFSIMMTYEGGHKIRNTDLPYLGGSSLYTNIRVVNKDIINRWQKPGDEAVTDIPRLVFPEERDLYNSNSETIYRNADINVLDARNIRIRNISLAYRLPEALLSRWGINRARVQMNAENVALFAQSKNAKNMLGGYRRPSYVMGLYLTF